MSVRYESVTYEPGALPRAVNRVLRVISSNPGQARSLRELAKIGGVSTRTLQRQFHLFLGQTPTKAIRSFRLESARRDLLLGNAAIADVAVRWGFPHFGRFSAEYRLRYRERPSETVRRLAINGPKTGEPRFFPAASDGPRLAVLPIQLRGMDRTSADDLKEELVTALLRSGFSVTEQAGRARYHIRGACRARDGKTYLLLRLLNAETGQHIWALEQDIGGGSDMSLQDRLAASLVAVLQTSLLTAEAQRVRRKPDSELSAEELTMKAWPLAISLGASTHQRAIELLERAMDRDPGHARATALAAWCHGQRAVYQFANDVSGERAHAVALASRGLRHANDSMTLAILGHAFACAHELATAEEVTGRALQIDGASAWAWGRSAWLETYKGQPHRAIERFTIALDLAPQDPLVFNNYAGLGCAYLHLRRYAEAAHWLSRAIARHPPASWAHRILCPAYLFSGNRQEAERSLAAINRLYPEARAGQCAEAAPLAKTDQALVVEGLTAMGLPA